MPKLEAVEYESFERIKKTDENGLEYWYARDMQNTLLYKKWHNFKKVIERAMLSCNSSGIQVAYHFVEVNKMAKIGSEAEKKFLDYKLTQYACCLIVQNDDPRKETIAFGQTYFAIQTRCQELADTFNQLNEKNKRRIVRGDIKQWNQLLAKAACNAGAITEEEFAIFQNSGYKGLYRGLTVPDIHKRKGLKKKDTIFGFTGFTDGTLIITNIFRFSETEEELKIDQASLGVEVNITLYQIAEKILNAMGMALPKI